MDARELLRKQIDDAGFQIEKVLESASEATMDFKATPSAMSPREAIVHLCECYCAATALAKGEKFEWGNYSPPSMETAPLIRTFQELRRGATEATLAVEGGDLSVADHYIVAHDYYHVGQICQARIASDPDWNSYSIYRS